MLLTDAERYTITLSSIRDYESGVNDISILLIEKVISQLYSIEDEITTQDIFDEIAETISYYNNFIDEKNIDFKKIPEEIIDLVENYINEVVMEINGGDIDV